MCDTTAFYLSLAYAVLFQDQSRGIPNTEFGENPESASYYSHSLQRLSKRLSDQEDCVSDGVIVTVLGLLCYDVGYEPS